MFTGRIISKIPLNACFRIWMVCYCSYSEPIRNRWRYIQVFSLIPIISDGNTLQLTYIHKNGEHNDKSPIIEGVGVQCVSAEVANNYNITLLPVIVYLTVFVLSPSRTVLQIAMATMSDLWLQTSSFWIFWWRRDGTKINASAPKDILVSNIF